MAVKLGDAVVYLIGDRKGLDKVLKKTEKDTKAWARKLGQNVAKFVGKAIKMGAVGAAGAIAGLTVGVTKLALESAKIDQTRQTFDQLARSIGSDAVEALNKLREATRGMVSDADLMQAGNKFMAMGLASTADEAAKLAEIATQLGTAMGEDATTSMENFALMLANQSIPRLDSFGISSGKVRERIEELMESTEGMTREQAFMQAVMEQAEVTMKKVGEQGDTTAAQMARMHASTANLKDMIGQAFLPILTLVLGALNNLATKYGPTVITWAQTAATWLGEHLPAAMEKIRVYWQYVLKPPLEAAWKFVKKNYIPILASLATIILATVVPAFVAWATTAATTAAATIAALAPVVLPIIAIGAAVGALVWLWKNYWDDIRQSFIEKWNEIRYKFIDMKQWITITLPNAVQEFVNKWKERLDDMKNALKEKIDDAIQALKDKLQFFYKLGQNIIDSIRGGIIKRAKALIDKVRGVVNDAIQAAKNLLGISSPSKVFTAMGENMVAGMAEGIKRMARLPALEIAGVVGNAVGSANNIVNNYYTYHLTANYRNLETESSLRDTVRLLQMATG